MKHIPRFLLTGIFIIWRLFGFAQTPTLVTDGMIGHELPAFSLKDLDGKTVSLDDLKGKVIVVDFWATWCVPCVKSFPAMKLVVEKYKADPNVRILFIDTKEKVEGYEELVRKFMADNHYNFQVLLDDKTSEGKQGEFFSQFDEPYIPARFIVGPNGKVVGEEVGLVMDQPAEQMAHELEKKIEEARHSGK
jgi:thiol-disulfide isomerase/thioredoxin